MSISQERIAAMGLSLVRRTKQLQTSCKSKQGEGLLFVGGTASGTDVENQVTGRYGDDLNREEMKVAAGQAAMGLLHAISDGAGDLDRVESVLSVNILIACAQGMDQGLEEIADALSRCLVDALGARGEHTRTVLGVCALNENRPVLCDAVVALRS